MLSRIKTLTAAAMFCAMAATGSAAIAGTPGGNIAPDFTGIEKWLNSEPLNMQQLRGRRLST